MFAKYQYVLASWEDEDGDVITIKGAGCGKIQHDISFTEE